MIGIAETTGEWVSVFDGTYNGAPEFIHASRLKPVAGWKQVGTGSVLTDARSILKHEGFEALVTSAPFVAQDHETEKLADGVYEVDGAVPWGTDGGLPRLSLSLSVTVNGTKILIPKEATRDLFEPNFETTVLLTPGDPSDRALLFMSNSDGAGAYGVFWAFAKGRYVSRAVLGLN